MQEIAYENVVCQIAAILPRYVLKDEICIRSDYNYRVSSHPDLKGGNLP